MAMLSVVEAVMRFVFIARVISKPRSISSDGRRSLRNCRTTMLRHIERESSRLAFPVFPVRSSTPAEQVVLSRTPGAFRTVLVPRGSSKPEWLP
jgi:hypothetical protein